MSYSQVIQQQADAWEKVCRTLQEICPDWTDKAPTGAQAACVVIRELAAKALIVPPDREPVGYAYRYPDGIRFNNGESVNGNKPTGVMPYWFAPIVSPLPERPAGEQLPPNLAWRDHQAAIDSKALATATEISLMWGQDRSQFVSRIQVAVTEAMEWLKPSLAAVSPQERPGWQWVSVEPTEAMLIAARDWSASKYGKPIGSDAASGCYAAMLAAAPKEEK